MCCIGALYSLIYSIADYVLPNIFFYTNLNFKLINTYPSIALETKMRIHETSVVSQIYLYISK